MTNVREQVKALRREHPVFFWGMSAVVLLLLIALVAVGVRIPIYRLQAAELNAAMTDAERETRDRILNSQARRSELAVALLQRELRLRAVERDEIHLAISVADSTLSLRHGMATLRETRISVGMDSTVVAADGRTWRFVRALGERRIADKERDPTYEVPEWIYVSRGEPIPGAAERSIPGGLGAYVLRLNDGTEIHTRPKTGPFATGNRPGGFIVEEEEEMQAIFDALNVDTPVFIY
jgi:hypothetical protein